jgi:hypothetical protein
MSTQRTEIDDVLTALWIRKQTAEANAFIVRRGKVKGYRDLAYYLGETNSLTDMIDWIEDYKEKHYD